MDLGVELVGQLVVLSSDVAGQGPQVEIVVDRRFSLPIRPPTGSDR